MEIDEGYAIYQVLGLMQEPLFLTQTPYCTYIDCQGYEESQKGVRS